MRGHGLPGLPVVDDQRQVVGYVDLLELAVHYLDDLDERASNSPPPR
jgi:hypothetical protein